jgi:hypothetical protein
MRKLHAEIAQHERKLAFLIVSVFLTAVLDVLGCSMGDRAAPIER